MKEHLQEADDEARRTPPQTCGSSIKGLPWPHAASNHSAPLVVLPRGRGGEAAATVLLQPCYSGLEPTDTSVISLGWASGMGSRPTTSSSQESRGGPRHSNRSLEQWNSGGRVVDQWSACPYPNHPLAAARPHAVAIAERVESTTLQQQQQAGGREAEARGGRGAGGGGGGGDPPCSTPTPTRWFAKQPPK